MLKIKIEIKTNSFNQNKNIIKENVRMKNMSKEIIKNKTLIPKQIINKKKNL
jgi:hypothetical protein